MASSSIYDELAGENNDVLGEMDFGADLIGMLMGCSTFRELCDLSFELVLF